MTNLLVLTILLVVGCSKTDEPTTGGSIELITYSSMVGDNSLGSIIVNEYKSLCEKEVQSDPTLKHLRCTLVLKPEDGDSSLVASFERKSWNAGGVLGLSDLQEKQLRSHPKFLRSTEFSESPYAFIVNTKLFPQEKWPVSWKEIPKAFANKVFIQDPRISSAGVGLLKAIHVHNLISSDNLKKISKKIFPSWSLSYSAFKKGEAPVVWSYQSSEAYHLCEENDDTYKALPLEEGYPVQQEWLWLSKNVSAKEAEMLVNAVSSLPVQSKIPTTNWMFPTNAQVKLPECYSKLSSLKRLSLGLSNFDAKTMQGWLDQWSL